MSIITNGTLIDDEAIKYLYRQKIKFIAISLDGWTSSSNDFIRGTGTFEKIVRTIEKLCLENKVQKNTYIPIYIQNLLTNQNTDEIDAMFELLDKYPDVQVSIGQITESGNASNHKECIVDQSKFRKAKQEIMTRNKQLRRRIFFKDESYFEGVWFNYLNGRSFKAEPPKCSIDENYYTLLPNGDMCKCIMLKDVEEKVAYEAVFGNILNENIYPNYNFDFDRSYKNVGRCKDCRVVKACNLCYIVSKSENKMDEQRALCDYYEKKINLEVDNLLKQNLRVNINKNVIVKNEKLFLQKDDHSIVPVDCCEKVATKLKEMMSLKDENIKLNELDYSFQTVEEMIYQNLIFKVE